MKKLFLLLVLSFSSCSTCPALAQDTALELDIPKLRISRYPTQSVWRSTHGFIEGNCPSEGFPIPDTKTPDGKWIPCIGKTGQIEPVYTEAKVTVYPHAIKVDYSKSAVTSNGDSAIQLPR